MSPTRKPTAPTAPTVLTGFDQPTVVDDVLTVFPGNVSHLMPPYDHYSRTDPLAAWGETVEAAPYLAFQRTWFYGGLSGDSEMTPRDGVDLSLVIRHLRCIQGSFEPKHEHKELAVAWLLWRWCSSVKAVPRKK